MANLKDLIVNGSARILGALYAPDIKNSSRTTEFIVGTQTASTGSWTGVTQDTALYDGKSIHYFLPYAGNGNATLNLTLAGGGTTGAKPIYLWGTSYVTTHYPVNSCINMTYNATKGAWFVNADRDSNDWANKLCYNNNIYAVEAITAGKLICGNKNGYKNVASGVTFDISYPILYAGSNINASAKGSNNFFTNVSINLQNTKASWTGTEKSVVYLVGTLSGTTFTIDSSVFTTTVPSTADGKVYIPLGILYSTYQIYFVSCKDLYAYRNGSFQLLQPDLSSYVPTTRKVNNKALSADISLTASDVGALSSHQTIKNHGTTGATINTYAACSTAAGTAAKTASITTGTFNLETGCKVYVKFANANTASTPTLNINSKGAKNIFHKGAQITTGDNKALLAGICEFMYDGTQWHLVGNYIDTNTVYTHPTTSGNKHIPSGGSSGQILKYSSDGTATWAAEYSYTHPTTSGNKHIPSGGSSGKILKWSADGTATWAAEYSYTHPTTSGNKHIPSGGSSGQFLKWSSDGTATWAATPTEIPAQSGNSGKFLTTNGSAVSWGSAVATSQVWYDSTNSTLYIGVSQS